ncbi:hypothetical protein PAXRUDRAFT_763809 [Paxillus rubicundulus Ve08.2h10]|uniref:Unplaced genomic scaffold scaffold_1077, whole genome shotgun sequence n=1 Tax=Paxillus rubicundulus Ve08.2h10 TaxID=930991 RepID=A0A0D0CZ77_9AGAM|nr:hypothetical protein PAXRUDRAFT_763809 [Paxillus rubicundulus Ve08.2h10]
MMLQMPSSSPLMSPENFSLPSSPILSATTNLASGNLADIDKVNSTSQSPLWISLLASMQSKGALTKAEGTVQAPSTWVWLQSALETLFASVTEVKDSRNASVDVAKCASTTPFWQTYNPKDHYVLIVHSDSLIKDLPDLKAMSGPHFSRAKIGKSSILMSPSKVKARATSQAGSSSGIQGGRKAGGQWKISDLKDPQGRYARLLNSHPTLHDTSVITPNVQDGKGVLIPPGEYASKLHDGDIVKVEIILKLWNIKANKSGNNSFTHDANGSRVYQLVLKNMTLLPAERYTQPTMIKVPNFKGKQKASSEAQGQSPTKKAVGGGSKSAAQDMDVL